MAYGTVNADLITDSNGGRLSPVSSVFRNRIINGNMVIDQRNAGASVATTTTGAFTYTLDRWSYLVAQASKFTIQQNAASVTPPAGFSYYLGCTSTSAYSVAAGDYFAIVQKIEGFNFADFGWGTANAKTITLSFQVYSSLTGTFGGSLRNSASSRSYPFTYTISTANTWTSISITIAGDTSGTWIGATNGVGLELDISLGAGTTYSGTAGSWSGGNYTSATGAVSVVGTSGATFYITGVQLEVGSSATGFEYVDYTTQLAMCMRYYQLLATSELMLMSGANYMGIPVPLFVQMRTTPTTTAATGGSVSNLNTAQENFIAISSYCIRYYAQSNGSGYMDIQGRLSTASAEL
jgi:hypothetical protein